MTCPAVESIDQFLVATEGLQPERRSTWLCRAQRIPFSFQTARRWTGLLAETFTSTASQPMARMLWGWTRIAVHGVVLARSAELCGCITDIRVPAVAGRHLRDDQPTTSIVTTPRSLRRPSDTAGKAFSISEADRLCALAQIRR